MIDLINTRRKVWPLIERYDRDVIGTEIFAVGVIRQSEYAGVLPTSVGRARRKLKGMTKVYANNAAALKYVERDGERSYEQGSYAYRPDGFFGKWQLHMRLFEHEDGTALFAHWELNPYHSPRKHYNGVHLQDNKGVEKALDMFPELEQKSLDGIVMGK